MDVCLCAIWLHKFPFFPEDLVKPTSHFNISLTSGQYCSAFNLILGCCLGESGFSKFPSRNVEQVSYDRVSPRYFIKIPNMSNLHEVPTKLMHFYI